MWNLHSLDSICNLYFLPHFVLELYASFALHIAIGASPRLILALEIVHKNKKYYGMEEKGQLFLLEEFLLLHVDDMRKIGIPY